MRKCGVLLGIKGKAVGWCTKGMLGETFETQQFKVFY